MRRYKPLIGVMMIVLAISCILLWEWKGRAAVVTETVLVAGEQIEKGAVVEAEMVKPLAVMKESKVVGAIAANQPGLVLGKQADRRILPNEQITELMFVAESQLAAGVSIFQLKPEWIDSRSSSLRKGDVVQIYGAAGEPLLGSYQVAFVKDQHEQEVESAAVFERSLLDRTTGTAQVSHIEIVAELAEYEKIRSFAVASEVPSLLLVQTGDDWDDWEG